MHILLVNDDGISSPRLHLLAQAARRRGHRVTVCAPAVQQSAKSHSFTIAEPLLVRECSVGGADRAFAVDGTPVDCTRIGLMGLCRGTVDLVLSGINDGLNIGLATYVSGTCGAAREAAFLGVRALAVSMEMNAPEEGLRFLAEYAVLTAEQLLAWPLPEKCCCNLNAPALRPEAFREPVVAPLSLHVYRDEYEERISPRGLRYFWLCAERPDSSPEPFSDVGRIGAGHLTLTFLTPEPCDQSRFEGLPLPLEAVPRR